MAKHLGPMTFDLKKFKRELSAFERLLTTKAKLQERLDIQPFFERHQHLSAALGTYAPNVGPATELAFSFPFFGDYSADVVVGNKAAGEFCIVEFEDGNADSIFKRQPKRGNPEWSARFEHGFSQLVDWFFHLNDFRGTESFAKTFGYGHIRFVGLLVAGRRSGLDDAKRNRLRWRSERVLIDSHSITCTTFDDLAETLRTRFAVYSDDAALGMEN
jgi:hypothetical protein